MQGCPLWRRELEVLALLAARRTRAEITLALGITDSTVRTLINQAVWCLGATSEFAAVMVCLRKQWVTRDGIVLAEPSSAPRAPPPRHRAHRRDRSLTAWQQTYLIAFDLHLRASTDADQDATRRLMLVALNRVLHERDVTIVQRRGHRQATFEGAVMALARRGALSHAPVRFAA